MQLSAELYSQIVKDLVSDGLGEFGRQQRREPRVGVRAKAYILPSLSAATPPASISTAQAPVDRR